MPDFEIEGSPGNIRSKALTMEQKGQLFYDTGDALSKIDVSGWTGRAADEFREAHDLEPDRWITSGNGFKKAAAGLTTYAGELEDAQRRADEAKAEYGRGQRESESARTQYDSYMGRMRTYWAGGGTDQAEPFVDWGDPIQQEALRSMQAVRADLDTAAHTCAGQVKAGCADAPEEPNWLESGLTFVGGILEGAGEAVWDLLTMVPFSPVNLVMDAYKLATGDLTPEELMKKYELSAENAWEMARGIYTGLTTDPIGFGKELGKSLLDWDTWADDPARAIGHLVPDAVVAVATAGTGALATRGAKGTMDVIDGLSDLRHLDDLADLRHLDDLGDLRRLDNMPDDLRNLIDKPVGDLTPGEIERLTRRATRSGSSPEPRCSGSSPRTCTTTTCAAPRPIPASTRTSRSASPRGPRTSPTSARHGRCSTSSDSVTTTRSSLRTRTTSRCCATRRTGRTSSTSRATPTSVATATGTRARSTRATRSPATATPPVVSPSSATSRRRS